jgi:hypothetical protein
MKKLSKVLVYSVLVLSSGLLPQIASAAVSGNDGLVSNAEETQTVNNVLATPILDQIEFIKRFYQNILNRSADPEGMSFWLKQMQSTSGASVALGFFKSDEYLGLQLNDSEFIDILYSTLFGREADEGGRNYWMAELEAGKLRGVVISGFLVSREFQALADKFGVVAFDEDSSKLIQIKSFVQRFYQLVLDREADEEGFNYWSSHLSSGEETGGEIATGFFNSTEFLSRNITDSEFADILYRAFFDREADVAGKEFWMAQLSRGGSRQSIIDGFIASREFTDLAARFGILASRERFTAEMLQNRTFYFVNKDAIERFEGIFHESTYQSIEQDGRSHSGNFSINEKGSLILDDGRSLLTIVSTPNADFLQLTEVESDDGQVSNLRMYYDESKADEYYNSLVSTQGGEIACTSDNFTSEILSSIQQGMSLELVNQTIGCTFNAEDTVRTSEGLVLYSWKMLTPQVKLIQVFFDGAGNFATPVVTEQGSILTISNGF